ncbi:MAG TPA: hypothetical protein VGU90_12880 [Terriglobales bacterium]|nr:hypothetical protein [Terriglobales bacterium]
MLFVAAVSIIVQLRKHAPPEAARLLPGADGFLYINLQWIRRAQLGTHVAPVQHDPEYDQFIQATGFDFERDLAQAAFAIHYASPATRGETRYSEILIAHLDGDKLRAYLKKIATSIESYRSVDIYSIPLERRTLRVAILGVAVCTPHLCEMLAASNHNDPAVIRGMVDRSRKLASPFGGPALLRQFYKYVPQLPLPSLGWAVFKVNSNFSSVASTRPATLVASVRYLGAVHFRAEAFTPDEQSAEQLASQANNFLTIFQSAEIAVGVHSTDPDFKRAIDSIKIDHKKERATITAILPSALIEKLVSEAPGGLSPKAK